MNEHQPDALWREGSDPFALLDSLYPPRTLGSERPQDRKCRLYLCACARRQWYRLPGACRALVEVAEYVAESPREREPLRAKFAPHAERLMHSEGTRAEMLDARGELRALLRTVPRELRTACRHGLDWSDEPPDGWRELAALVYLPFVPTTPPLRWVPAELHSVALLREVYYNPHAFVPFRPEWRTADVLALAKHVYDAHEFSDLPVLADALEDAGCDLPAVLRHFRDAPPGEHVRGCWALDLVLNRG